MLAYSLRLTDCIEVRSKHASTAIHPLCKHRIRDKFSDRDLLGRRANNYRPQKLCRERLCKVYLRSIVNLHLVTTASASREVCGNHWFLWANQALQSVAQSNLRVWWKLKTKFSSIRLRPKFIMAKAAMLEGVASIPLHTLRRDGLTFLETEGDQGRFLSKPIVWLDPKLSINANAPHGEVRFQLTDMESRPVEGFTFEDSVPMQSSDATHFPVRWKNDNVEQVIGKIFRLEVRLRHARLFAIRGHFHFIDAQDRSQIQDGQLIAI